MILALVKYQEGFSCVQGRRRVGFEKVAGTAVSSLQNAPLANETPIIVISVGKDVYGDRSLS